MSITYSIFINKNIPIAEVKANLEGVLNCQLEKDVSVDWDLYRGRILGLEVSLVEANDYEDDQGIEFTKYSYQVIVDYLPAMVPVKYAYDWMKTGSLVLGNMISKEMNCECIVVRDVQRLIAEFP